MTEAGRVSIGEIDERGLAESQDRFAKGLNHQGASLLDFANGRFNFSGLRAIEDKSEIGRRRDFRLQDELLPGRTRKLSRDVHAILLDPGRGNDR